MDPIAKLLGDWSVSVNIYSVLFKIIIAIILGAIIGTERANKRHAAGLRTFILVYLSSTIAMMVDCYLNDFYVLSLASIIGVAILSGNSTLYTSRSQIKGLTTSVGLWASALVGLSLGAGYYSVTIISFIAELLGLAFFPRFEIYLKNRSNHFEIHLELKNISYLKDFVTVIRKLGLVIDDIESNPAYINSGLSVYSISISITNEQLKKYKSHKEIIDALRSLEYVYYIEEMR